MVRRCAGSVASVSVEAGPGSIGAALPARLAPRAFAANGRKAPGSSHPGSGKAAPPARLAPCTLVRMGRKLA